VVVGRTRDRDKLPGFRRGRNGFQGGGFCSIAGHVPSNADRRSRKLGTASRCPLAGENLEGGDGLVTGRTSYPPTGGKTDPWTFQRRTRSSAPSTAARETPRLITNLY